ncbi:MAG: hypothetical protein KBD63_01645, partial [Bacteriovoracaceae bacterium]|nr:hypothetical protein [Bacteriovoracaceae bacterium]
MIKWEKELSLIKSQPILWIGNYQSSPYLELFNYLLDDLITIHSFTETPTLFVGKSFGHKLKILYTDNIIKMPATTSALRLLLEADENKTFLLALDSDELQAIFEKKYP